MGKKSTPKTYDIDAVRAAASKRWPEILASVCGLPRETFDGNHQPCPKCGGADRFRAFTDDSGGGICNQCWTDKNGDGISFVQWYDGSAFFPALRKIADYLGIQPSLNGSAFNKESADPAEHLIFRDWCKGDETVLSIGLLAAKPGISFGAILACGGRVARYRNQFTVVALPVYGAELLDAEPVGWCLYNVTGGPLPKYGRDKSVEWVKVKLTHGSKPGLIGQVAAFAASRAASAVEADPNAETPNGPVIWKCEGPSDVLATISVLSLSSDVSFTNHVVLTNANGASEKPQPWMLALFAGRRVNVIHDADKPGQDGAIRWSTAIASTAFECRNVKLPYPIVPDHGPDLRDYFARDNHTLADLLQLADASPIIESPDSPSTTAATSAAGQPSINEDEKDPHRLARIFLESIHAYVPSPAGPQLALRFWHSEFWRWNGRCYRAIPSNELPAMVNAVCKIEFDKINALPTPKGEWRKPISVSRAFTNNVIAALEAICLLPATVEPNSWLGAVAADGTGHAPGRKLWLSMENGILRLDDLLADPDEPPIQPHSPLWFSPIALPYEFVPDATCPRFLEVLNHNQEGDPDRIAILQEWAGYILTPSTDQQKFLVLEGEGANGKSVYLAALQAMIGGENVSNVPLELFEDRFALTNSLGKLLNVSADASEVEKAAEGKLKSLVSGDVMFFDRKGIGGVNAQPTARLVIAANNRPRFSDRSSGIWRRMLLVPWNVKITADQRVAGMDKPDWWVTAGELPGIFWWAVLGLARLRDQGRFTDAAACRDALDDYQTEANPAKAFLQENVIACEHSVAEAKEVYGTYKKWCVDNGYRALSDKIFGKEVRRAFPMVERKQGQGDGGRVWKLFGIRLTTPEDF